VVVVATMETVRIFDGPTLIATHPRNWDKWQQVEVDEHVRELVEWKQGKCSPRHRTMASRSGSRRRWQAVDRLRTRAAATPYGSAKFADLMATAVSQSALRSAS